jgi:hypothetical protein
VRIVISDVGLQHWINTALNFPFHEFLVMRVACVVRSIREHARQSVADIGRCLAKD